MFRTAVVFAFGAALAGACNKSDSTGGGAQAQAAPAAATPTATAPAAAAQPARTGGLPDIGLPLAREVEGAMTGGQPSDAALEAAAKAGYKTVINMRGEGEHDGAAERARVEGLGMKYVALPIASAEDLSEQKARELDKLLAESDGPIVVHCGSGNRVGALYALREHFVRGAAPADALAFGRRAGLTALAGKVAAILGV